MSFRNPFAWMGLATLVVPVLIHLLVRAPAQPVVVASLRFIPGSPMRAWRRRLLTDYGLLLLRMAVLALAAAALADPLVTSGCRRAAWDARVSRAVVIEARAATAAAPRARDLPPASVDRTFTASDLRAAIAEAVAWLGAAPPSRRELVVIGDLRLGALDEPALRDVPADVGLRFVRTAGPVPEGSREGPTVVRSGLDGLSLVRDRVTVEGARTLSSSPAAPATPAPPISNPPSGLRMDGLGLEIACPEAARPALRAALTAALAVGAPWPASSAARPVLVVLDPASGPPPAAGAPRPLSHPWMATAARAILDDPEIGREARASIPTRANALDPPWLPTARTRAGDAVVAVAESGHGGPGDGTAMIVLVRAAPASPLWPLVLHRVLASRADGSGADGAEVLPIPDAQLTRWSRPAGPVTGQTVSRIESSDRAWLWAAALAALGVEGMWRRRGRTREVREGRRDERAA